MQINQWAIIINEARDEGEVHVGTRAFSTFAKLHAYATQRCGFTPQETPATQTFQRDQWIFKVKETPENRVYTHWTRQEITARQAVPGTRITVESGERICFTWVGEWRGQGDGTAALIDHEGRWMGIYGPDHLFELLPPVEHGPQRYTLTEDEREARSESDAENAWLRAAENNYFCPEEGGY